MAITSLSLEQVRARLGLEFSQKEDVLGTLHLATRSGSDGPDFQIRIYEESPEPSTEIMLRVETAEKDLDAVLENLGLRRDDLFWIHPRAGGTLRRHVVDVLHANLSIQRPLVQILVGPRQVGKTTAVRHLIKEWTESTHYATADGIVSDHGPWLEMQWQEALLKGEGALLVIDEIQKVKNWSEIVKALWDKTMNRGLRVVLLGSTSLSDCLDDRKESLAGRFQTIYVPHWSFLETHEAFGSTIEDYTLYGGYPKAMEFIFDKREWFNYIGTSIVNPIIDIDIYQHGKFRNLEALRKSFSVFCQEASLEINYRKLLKQIQQAGNVDLVKRFLEGYYDSFLMSKLLQLNDRGYVDHQLSSKLIINCPAVYSFGRGSFDSYSHDIVRLHQSVASELRRIPHTSLGYWQKSDEVGIDLVIKTIDSKVFGLVIDGYEKGRSRTKSFDAFRSTFRGARIATVGPENVDQFLQGHRAFLETAAL